MITEQEFRSEHLPEFAFCTAGVKILSSTRNRIRCQAKFLTSHHGCAHAQSSILHIIYAEKTDGEGLGFGVYISVRLGFMLDLEK